MRQRKGGIVTKRGRLFARVTWVENGKRKARWRKADSFEHAQSLCEQMLKEVPFARQDGTLGSPELQPHHRHRIYFIQMLDGHVNPIKIGVARNVVKRVYSLSTGSPFPLRVLFSYVPEGSTMMEERRLHQMFEASRLRGEWFLPTKEVLAHLKKERGLRRKKPRRPRLSQLIEFKAKDAA